MSFERSLLKKRQTRQRRATFSREGIATIYRWTARKKQPKRDQKHTYPNR